MAFKRLASGASRARKGLVKYKSTLKGKSEAGVARAVDVLVIGAGAYGTAMLDAKLGGAQGYSVKGVPLPLVVGGACVLASMTKAAGKQSKYLLKLGEGAIAGQLAGMGRAQGLKMATAAPPATATVKGEEYDPFMPVSAFP